MKKHNIFLLVTIVGLCSCQQPTLETRPVRQDVIETVFASGTLEANNTYHLTALNDGYLVEIYFEEGALVQKGQVLAVVENHEKALDTENARELYQIALQNARPEAPARLQAQTTVASAKQKMEQDYLQEQRLKRLWDSNSIARSEYETALLTYQTSKNNYENALLAVQKLDQETAQQIVSPRNQVQVKQLAQRKNTIRAVESGKVYQKLKQKGDFVRQGEVIAIIGDPDFIYAKVQVDESSIERVKPGQEALVQLNTQKNKSYRARVWEILPAFDEAQQSFVCKLKFEDAPDFRIVKTQLQSNITVDTQRNALLIPRLYLDYGGYVFVKKGKDKEKIKVETQFVSSDWVQVISGIDMNVTLVTTNVPGAGGGLSEPKL